MPKRLTVEERLQRAREALRAAKLLKPQEPTDRARTYWIAKMRGRLRCAYQHAHYVLYFPRSGATKEQLREAARIIKDAEKYYPNIGGM